MNAQLELFADALKKAERLFHVACDTRDNYDFCTDGYRDAMADVDRAWKRMLVLQGSIGSGKWWAV